MQNHFELFQLPAQFSLDMSALDAAYRDVQGKVHPDRFINASSAESAWRCNGPRAPMKPTKP